MQVQVYFSLFTALIKFNVKYYFPQENTIEYKQENTIEGEETLGRYYTDVVVQKGW